MTDNYDILAEKRNIAEAESEWDSPIEFSENSNTHRLIEALLTEADRVDTNLENIYEQQHVDSATGKELDQFGELVNVERKTGEGDDKYRARIKAAFRASTMGATFDQFVEFCANILNTDITNLNFRTNYGARPATVNVGADPSVYDSVNLTDAEVRDLLGEGVPAGHEVRVLEGGTFRLIADGQTNDPDKGLTSDSISSGGTLAADLV